MARQDSYNGPKKLEVKCYLESYVQIALNLHDGLDGYPLHHEYIPIYF